MSAEVELPRWQCHKIVRAAKIKSIAGPDESGRYSLQLLVDEAPPRFAYTKVGPRFMERHKPTGDGYYVVYEDGYHSWSPAAAFEKGYTRLEGKL